MGSADGIGVGIGVVGGGFVVPPALSSSAAPAFWLGDGIRRFRGFEIRGGALA
jgi:hypothetical protein